ncbi:Yip1 family protein [Hydrogenophaga sp. 5NK40-0174]|uniref:Yip1 family protein n=1 Tax=Hydrogenophaga sp. 5NK40-0174 TaxID=3127649 RepID=UPI0031066C6D
MNVVDRVKQVIMEPGKAWPSIEGENAGFKDVLFGYVLVLAGISAFGQFLAAWVWGIDSFGGALLGFVRDFILLVAGTFVLAWLAKALAPIFGGRGSFDSAYRLVVYASTAVWLAALVSVVPVLGFLVALGAMCWTIYTLYLGAPVLMMIASKSKTVGYTAALVVSGIVVGLIMAAIFGVSDVGRDDVDVHEDGDHAKVDINLPGMNISVDTGKMEAAQEALEKAEEEGVQAKAMSTEALQPFVPESVADWTRKSFKSTHGNVGMAFSSVEARYTQDGDKRLELKVMDIGAAPVLKMAAAAWSSVTLHQEEGDEVTNIYQADGYAIKEQYRKSGQSAEMAMLLPNGVMVELSGTRVGIEELKGVAEAIDIKGLAGLSRP